MVRPFFYYELYTITFKRVFLETRFFQTAAIISQKLVNWFYSNLHSIFSIYIAKSWNKIIKIASLFFYQLNRPKKNAKNGIFYLKRKKNIFWNSDFILVPCRASSLTIEMIFGFLISDKQNSRNHGSSGAPLFLYVFLLGGLPPIIFNILV